LESWSYTATTPITFCSAEVGVVKATQSAGLVHATGCLKLEAVERRNLSLLNPTGVLLPSLTAIN
jgi:hypothetical protein